MTWRETALPDVWRIDLPTQADERGWFRRSYCEREFVARGLELPNRQSSYAFNQHRGTLRGLHWQIEPFAEAKLVTCVSGSVLDVVADLRESSPYYLRHVAVELNGRFPSALYIPRGFAHGYLTLESGTLLGYQMSADHQPESARGVRWDDPALAIRWPFSPEVISSRDASWPAFVSQREGVLTCP